MMAESESIVVGIRRLKRVAIGFASTVLAAILLVLGTDSDASMAIYSLAVVAMLAGVGILYNAVRWGYLRISAEGLEITARRHGPPKKRFKFHDIELVAISSVSPGILIVLRGERRLAFFPLKPEAVRGLTENIVVLREKVHVELR